MAGCWHTVCRTSLALAVIAVVVSDVEGISVDRVRDSLAEAVTGETHFARCVLAEVERKMEEDGGDRYSSFDVGSVLCIEKEEKGETETKRPFRLLKY
jgi:hypothetical protein